MKTEIVYFMPFLLIFGSTVERPIVTKHSACSDGAITFQCDTLGDVDVTIIDDFYWKMRFSHSTNWIVITYCNRSKECTEMIPVLPDGTRVSSSNITSLTVEHSAESNSTYNVQFKCEIHLADSSVYHRIFLVNFTVECVWAWIDAKLNLTRVLLNIYPQDQVLEIELYDVNGTKFAYYNTERGATVNVTDGNRQMPSFWKRLKVTGGSLMLDGIQCKDNGLEIRSDAHLTPLNTKVKSRRAIRSNIEQRRVDIIRVLVNTSQGPPPSFSSVVSSSLSSTMPVWFAPTKPNGASAANGQPWTVIIIPAAAAVVVFVVVA